jgi:hypothetical protein
MDSVAQALHDRFDEVCRAELQRLRKKTARLSEAQRAEVDAIAVQVAHGIAARAAAALTRHDDRRALERALARLFGVGPADARAGAA